MQIFWKCLLLSLIATFLFAGTALFNKYSFSVRTMTPDFTRQDECMYGGPEWECVARSGTLPARDAGAVSWQEIPLAHFLSHNDSSFLKWNPFIGSGYPIYLDGISKAWTPSRLFLRYFPSEQGRDFLIFLRLWLWSFGFCLGLSFLKIKTRWLFLATFFSLMIGYVIRVLDIVYLDVDLLAPWLWAWALWEFHINKGTRKNLSVLFGLLLGIWVGAQAFAQSQATLSLVLLVIVASLTISQKKLSFFYGFLAYSLGFFIFGLPYALDVFLHFSDLISTRSAGACLAETGFGLPQIWEMGLIGYRKLPEWNTLFSVGGLVLIATRIKSRDIRPFLIAWIVLLAWSTFGLSHLSCQIPGISGIGFIRHLTPHVQAGFYILLWWSFFEIFQGIQKSIARFAMGIVFVVLCLASFARHEPLSLRHLKGKAPLQHDIYPASLPEKNILFHIQKLSKNEDRRHFSPDARLYPNYSASLDILDQRVINPLYPKYYYLLNTRLSQRWQHDSADVTRPDRFVGPTAQLKTIPEDFQKILALNRVSLISFSKTHQWLEEDGLYSQKNCRKIKEDELAQLWECPLIKGVGFFPDKVFFEENDDLILDQMMSRTPAELSNVLFVKACPTCQPQGAQGNVIGFKRSTDKMTYDLQINSEGYFVFADSWFPGWKAFIDGKELEIFRANIAFKSVYLSEGSHILTFEFQP